MKKGDQVRQVSALMSSVYELLLIRGTIGLVELSFLVDTGTDISLLPLAIVEEVISLCLGMLVGSL